MNMYMHFNKEMEVSCDKLNEEFATVCSWVAYPYEERTERILHWCWGCSVRSASHVQYTTNGMCTKNSTRIASKQ